MSRFWLRGPVMGRWCEWSIRGSCTRPSTPHAGGLPRANGTAPAPAVPCGTRLGRTGTADRRRGDRRPHLPLAGPTQIRRGRAGLEGVELGRRTSSPYREPSSTGSSTVWGAVRLPVWAPSVIAVSCVPPARPQPCQPVPADQPPAGPDWIHEIKHDGYRLMACLDSARHPPAATGMTGRRAIPPSSRP